MLLEMTRTERMRRRVLWINGALLAALVVVGVVSYELLSGSGAAAAVAQTTTVRQGTITSTVSASGNAGSATNIGVSFTDCTGNLTSVSVKAGQIVTAGQVLATVDTSTAQASVTSAQ
jgi:macrolide-specific efflux system membrane fusion protein